jgi:hypothetical protein
LFQLVFVLENPDEIVRVESTNIDRSQFCSYQWHTVMVTLSARELRLKIDDQPWVTTEAQAVFPQTPRDAEFFIGGYPSK